MEVLLLLLDTFIINCITTS